MSREDGRGPNGPELPSHRPRGAIRYRTAYLASALLWSGPAAAGNCDDLVATGFPASPGAVASGARAQACQTSDEDPDALVCRWEFAHRDPASRRAFDTLAGRLGACASLVESNRDKAVNHPDFYDAWTYRFGRREVTVSIKDKSALDATFVVLRQRSAY